MDPVARPVPLGSLESFHPRRSNRPTHQDRLTQRESNALHCRHRRRRDGSKRKNRRGRRKGLKTLRPPGLPFIAQTMRCERLWALRSAIND
jgi:hypothetical protein